MTGNRATWFPVMLREGTRVALFGNNERAEVAALHRQLAEAQGTIAELRGWDGHLRGAETGPDIGAFGPDVVEIGTTRRLAPMDRVRGLGEFFHATPGEVRNLLVDPSDDHVLEPPARAAAWLTDPLDDALVRYWDGHRWTFHTAVRRVEPAAPASPPVPALRPDVAQALERVPALVDAQAVARAAQAAFAAPRLDVL